MPFSRGCLFGGSPICSRCVFAFVSCCPRGTDCKPVEGRGCTCRSLASLWANAKSAADLPGQQPICQAFLQGYGLPHLVAPKSAMSSPQSPPCPAPAKGQSRATLPWVSFPHKACRFAGPRGYAGQRPEQGNAPLGLLSPQRVSLCGVPCTGSQ